MLEKYAQLLIDTGLHVKKDQLVVIKAPVEVCSFVEIAARTAFEAGAKDVIVRYQDERITHLRYQRADREVFEHIPSYESDFYNRTSQNGACYLTLVGQDPDLMNDVDPKRMVAYTRAFQNATRPYRKRLDFMECQWCIAGVATSSWAEKIYPGDSDAVNKLWQDIFTVSRVNENWNEHKKAFELIVDKLNHLNIRSLHYQNDLGTDVTVELPEQYRFEGGGSTLKDGMYYFPNIPTEEVFSAPLRTGVNGTLYASMPLSYQGSLIEDFFFTFSKGRVVDYDAETGKDILKSILSSDENACYLGEIALVPFDSPISRRHQMFYETLIDENASCHFALGQSYAECLQGGLEMNEAQLSAHGMNQSPLHVDFMVGTPDLSIVAQTRDGQEIPIFINGNYSSYFSD